MSDMSRLEKVVMYLVGFSFAQVVLHSYVGPQWGRFSLRATIFGHQVILLSSSLYNLTVMRDRNVRLWHGFRTALIGYCVVSEILRCRLQNGIG